MNHQDFNVFSSSVGSKKSLTRQKKAYENLQFFFHAQNTMEVTNQDYQVQAQAAANSNQAQNGGSNQQGSNSPRQQWSDEELTQVAKWSPRLHLMLIVTAKTDVY